MEPKRIQCALCGAEIDAAAGGCAHCLPRPDQVAVGTRPPDANAGAGEGHTTAPPATQSLEFEAEESLARGDATRALVLASKALRQRPESLTLRSLVERARKLMLRGRRGERLEQRLREAQELLTRGERGDAERIVSSALTLIPNHAEALALFARIKQLRLADPTIEAEAERELRRLAGTQAHRAVARAQSLRASGNERGALIAVRRALRHTPDHAELLALFAELQEVLTRSSQSHSSLRERVERARAQLAAGRIIESRDALRALLREDPDFAPAQALMGEVRSAFLARSAAATRVDGASVPATQAQAWSPLVADIARSTRTPLVSGGTRSVPPTEDPRRGTHRQSAHPALLAAVGLFALGAMFFLAVRVLDLDVGLGRRPAPVVSEPDDEALAEVAPALRHAVAEACNEYRTAIEARDPIALARARPDLAPESRGALLGALDGASSVRVELRVVEVTSDADQARVRLLRSVTVSGAAREAPAPVEETLRFVRRYETWRLR